MVSYDTTCHATYQHVDEREREKESINIILVGMLGISKKRVTPWHGDTSML